MLNTPRVPFRISSDVLRFVATIKLDGNALFVDVKPETWAIERECFPNVLRKVNEAGGRIQYGWAIWQCEHYFIEAEHHAVYADADTDSLIDITPREPHASRILFLPDDSAIYDFNTTDQRDNIRMALVNDLRVHRMLELFSARTALVNSVPTVGGQVSLTGNAAMQFFAIEKEIARIAFALKQEQIPNIWKIT